eukprot:3466278-Amphidinium_carterae.1
MPLGPSSLKWQLVLPSWLADGSWLEETGILNLKNSLWISSKVLDCTAPWRGRERVLLKGPGG